MVTPTWDLLVFPSGYSHVMVFFKLSCISFMSASLPKERPSSHFMIPLPLILILSIFTATFWNVLYILIYLTTLIFFSDIRRDQIFDFDKIMEDNATFNKHTTNYIIRLHTYAVMLKYKMIVRYNWVGTCRSSDHAECSCWISFRRISKGPG